MNYMKKSSQPGLSPVLRPILYQSDSNMAQYGLQEVHCGEDPAVDIVFLHGLRGNVTQTWTKGTTLWPRDLLKEDIPNSRILLYGYDSSIANLDRTPITETDLRQDAVDVCAKLSAKRSTEAEKTRPIIFIAHSLGGLVAAQALVLGERMSPGDAAAEVAKNLRGMVFFGTPFRGSGTAHLGDIVRSIVKMFRNTQSSTLKLLQVDSERLVGLSYEFPEILRKRQSSGKSEDKIDAFFFWEGQKTHNVWVVEDYSAQLPGCGESARIRANHMDMCKFEAPTDEGYDILLRTLKAMMVSPDPVPETGKSTSITNAGSIKTNQYVNGDMRIDNQTMTFGGSMFG